MKREEIIEKLLEIEQKIPVYDWMFMDVQLWPSFKENLFFTLLQQKQASNKKKSYTDYVKKATELFYYFIHQEFKQKDIVFLGASSHRTNLNNKFINRYYEPLKQNKSFLFVEYGGVIANKVYSEHVLDFNKYYKFPLLRNRFALKNQDLSLTGFESIKDIFGQEYSGVMEKLKTQLISNARTIKTFSDLFIKMFEKVKPKEVYTLCSYTGASYGFLHAANKMDIPNYEIQHGGLGTLHPMYTYANFPKQGINTLPQNFWLWDNASKSHFDTWLPLGGYHSALDKGNPWLAYALENQKVHIIEKRKIILYTLQYNDLDQYIIDAIANTPDSFIWYFRMHPRFMAEKEHVIQQLKEKNILDKVNIDDATTLPLPNLLEACHIHISKYSGSITEAECLGKKSIILGKIGNEIFSNYIKYGHSVGLVNPTAIEILDIIEKV